MRVADESADRFTNLFFAHADESIDEFLNMLEVAFADTLRSQPVGDGARRLLRREGDAPASFEAGSGLGDRKSTRLNSSHVRISYAVFCLKKKTKVGEWDASHESCPLHNFFLPGTPTHA